MEVFKKKLQDLAEKFSQEIKSLRTGRAATSLVEDILVDVYGKKTPLKHIASISLRPPSFIVIETWDEAVLPAVETSLKNSSLSLSISREGRSLKISFPPLSQEQRQNLVKVLSQKREDIRIAARHLRDEFLKDLKQKFQEKKIGEDEHFRQKESVDKDIKNFEEKISDFFKQKEKEILTV